MNEAHSFESTEQPETFTKFRNTCLKTLIRVSVLGLLAVVVLAKCGCPNNVVLGIVFLVLAVDSMILIFIVVIAVQWYFSHETEPKKDDK